MRTVECPRNVSRAGRAMDGIVDLAAVDRRKGPREPRQLGQASRAVRCRAPAPPAASRLSSEPGPGSARRGARLVPTHILRGADQIPKGLEVTGEQPPSACLDG